MKDCIRIIYSKHNAKIYFKQHLKKEEFNSFPLKISYKENLFFNIVFNFLHFNIGKYKAGDKLKINNLTLTFGKTNIGITYYYKISLQMLKKMIEKSKYEFSSQHHHTDVCCNINGQIKNADQVYTRLFLNSRLEKKQKNEQKTIYKCYNSKPYQGGGFSGK